jgi:hypothetical protein
VFSTCRKANKNLKIKPNNFSFATHQDTGIHKQSQVIFGLNNKIKVCSDRYQPVKISICQKVSCIKFLQPGGKKHLAIFGFFLEILTLVIS